MKRILHVIDSVEPGGAENVFIDLITNLDKEKYHNVVTIPGEGWLSAKLDQLNIEYHTIPASGKFNFKYLTALVALIKKERIDLVQSHLFGANVYSSLAGILTATPVVSVFHGAVDIAVGERLLWLKSKIIGLGSSKVIAVSNSLRDEVIHRTGISKNKVATIYNGVDTDRFSPRPHNELREKYGISKQGLLVASIGYLRPPKGYELLMKAAKELVQQGEEVCFLIAGDGEGEYKDFLYKERKKLNLEKHVLFIGGVDNPEYILNGCDVFLLPSISEGFSISTIEAMSCGLPVVVTKSGGPEEIVTTGRDGYLVDVDPKVMAKVISVYNNKGLRGKVGSEARFAIKDRFSIENTIESYQDLYEQIIKKQLSL